jgi:CelD/BcsL family acetyltransferase involved in cellulose biosynthesis
MLHRPTDFRSLPLNATDYTGSIWQNRQTESFRAIADYLQHEAKRMPVFLWNIRASDPLVECLTERRALIHLRETKILFAEIESCSYHPDRTQGSISVNELARKRKRLKDLGAQIRFSSHASGKELVSMIRIHMERWKQKGQEGNFADPCRVEFVQRLVGEPNMKLLFANMWLNGELLAYRLGPFDNRAYYDWNTGFNPAFKHFSPGVVLLESILVHLKTNSNIKNLDFLRGTELYKYAWASSASKVHEYSVIA